MNLIGILRKYSRELRRVMWVLIFRDVEYVGVKCVYFLEGSFFV